MLAKLSFQARTRHPQCAIGEDRQRLSSLVNVHPEIEQITSGRDIAVAVILDGIVVSYTQDGEPCCLFCLDHADFKR